VSRKRLLLVFPDISHDPWHTGYFHYGLASISAYLKSRIEGIDIRLLHIHDKKFSQVQFLENLRESSPHIVAFTSTAHSFPLIQQYARWLKDLNERETLIVCGGVHVTLDPEESLTSSAIDVAICGDGEYPMEALVNEWIENRRVPDEAGIWYREKGKVINNGCSIVKDLDSLPDPDWELFDYMNLSAPKQGMGGIMVSRGCPYKCSYCCNHRLTEIYDGPAGTNYVRFKSVWRSISEIKNFCQKFPAISTLYFDDDILPLNPKWFFHFAEEYKREVNKPFWCNIRPNLVNYKIVEALVSSGCIRVGIGIESGNEKIRNEVLKRNIPDTTITNAVSLLKNYNVYTYGFNMVGLPKETSTELLDTIRMNANLGIDEIQCTIFYPYEHTAIYDLCVQNGLLAHSKWLIEIRRETVLKFDYAQKNLIYFTELTSNFVVKLYARIPKPLKELFLRILYSYPSAVIFLPILNILFKGLLASKKLGSGIRKIYRLFMPLPSVNRGLFL
jgi:anaerobic magnesium-protoporphyrin IX monomethyl ester cyclase